MNWSFKIIQQLSGEFLLPLSNIFHSSPYKFLHQDPYWLYVSPGKRIIILAFDDSKNIAAYAGLDVKPFKTLHVPFGPVMVNQDDMAALIAAMTKWLRRAGWLRITLQLPMPMDETAGVLLKELQKLAPFRQAEKLFNWKSWWLRIDREPEELFKAFSKNHKRSIKQNLKSAITFQRVADEKKALALAELSIEMYHHRKLYVDENLTRKQFVALNSYIQKQGNGLMIEAIFEGQLVGGLVIIFQGSHAYYYSGVRTFKYEKNLPVLYKAFYYVIEYCYNAGITILDFGGFDTGALPGSQMHNINRFKMGFGGGLKEYPELLAFDLNPFFSPVIERGILIRNKIRKWRQGK